MGALRDLLGDCFDQVWMAVAKEQCSVTHDVVDVFVAVDVPFSGADGAVDDDSERLEVACVVCDATGEDSARLLGPARRLGVLREEFPVNRRCRTHGVPPG